MATAAKKHQKHRNRKVIETMKKLHHCQAMADGMKVIKIGPINIFACRSIASDTFPKRNDFIFDCPFNDA
jgi:hypothetical protein